MRIAMTLCATVAFAAAGGVRAEIIVGLTDTNRLIQFNSATQLALTPQLSISGLQPGERILGIDFRPANSLLYGVGSSQRLYVIDTNTGVASAIGGPFATPLRGTKFGIDFNPVADRLRVTSNMMQNLSVNPNNGAATVQTDLSYAAGDPNASQPPSIVGAAYSNNFAGASTTRLFTVDSRLDILAVQNSSFDQGRMSTVGTLFVDTGELVGFDITSGSGTAFATFDIEAFPNSSLYRIDLSTGDATFLGGMDHEGRLTDIAVVIPSPGSLAILGGALGVAARRRRALASR